jgi:hypothetical protein
LKKPSRAAWALNQLARAHGDDVDALLRAGDAVRAAQDKALRGQPSELRDASRALAELVDDVAEKAEPMSAGVRDAVTSTLRAAATDPEVGKLLKQGTLVSELDPSGFGLEGAELPPDLEAKARKPKGPDPHLVADAERAEARANRLLAAAAEAETRAKEARLAADQAVVEAEAARAKVK